MKTKLLIRQTDRQTDRQTNNDENITSLAEVITHEKPITSELLMYCCHHKTVKIFED